MILLVGIFAALVVVLIIFCTILTCTTVLCAVMMVSDQFLLVLCHFAPEVAMFDASVIGRSGGLDVPHDDLGVSGARRDCATSVCID